MLIHNYGLFWRAEDVYWGRPNSTGHLMGIPAGAVSGKPVDFREQAGIYVLYADYQIVYVGQAGSKGQRLFSRLKHHRRDGLADRWNKFSWFGTRWVKQNNCLSADASKNHTSIFQVLNHIEAILISAAEPPLNRQGGKFGEKVKQFLQYRDVKMLGPNTEEMVRELFKKAG